MEPITLILTALAAGASAMTSTGTKESAKDAYNALKSRIKNKFSDKPDAEIALVKHEEKPKVWEALLKDALAEIEVDKDEEIIQAAQNLMKIINPQQAAAGKYNVQITGSVKGFVQADNTKVTMTFGSQASKE